MKKLVLPIGSIVELIESDSKVMIIGYLMKDESANYVYDYCGCQYPLGYTHKNKMLYFDKKDIRIIKKIGYIDEETQQVLSKVENEKMDKR